MIKLTIISIFLFLNNQIICNELPKNPRILIIGSGASGTATAVKLIENGFVNIQILEAENRIGGRVYPYQFSGNIIDLGAQWVHGEKDNIVFEKANELGLVVNSTIDFENLLYFNQNGDQLNEDGDLSKIVNLTRSIMVDDVDENEPLDVSYGNYMLKKINENLEQEDYKHINKDLLNMVLDWSNKAYCLDSACDNWFDASLNDYAEYVDNEGSTTITWKNLSYFTVFDILKKKLPNPKEEIKLDEKILLNKEVNRIILGDNEVTVKCKDNTEYKADHVIVTVSLGVLKSGQIIFEPELPEYKKTAIKGVGYGGIEKLFFEFSESWWQSDRMYSFLYSDKDKLLSNFNGTKEENQWLTDIYGFLTVQYRPNIIESYEHGNSARQIQYLPDEEIKEKFMKLTKMFLGKSYNITEPINFLRTKWFSNPHFLGTYSYRSLLTEQLKTSHSELSKPVDGPKLKNMLLFAGEATNPTHWATVHGAIETGYREADRLIKFYKKN